MLWVTLASCVSPAPLPTATMRGIIVDESQRPSAVSGVVSIYATAILASSNGQIRTLFFQYLDENQYLPRRGDRCEVGYRIGRIAGHLKWTPMYLDLAPRVQWIRCDSGSWSEADASE
jgi:hypothetical protein